MTEIPLPAGVFDPSAIQVARRLTEAGHIAYFAGGCVRNALLRRNPVDIDIATNATPDEVAWIFPGARFVGKSFGVTLVPGGEKWFEVATFRRDVGTADGRRPLTVEFTGPEEDARRRDFTINALFYDPVRELVIDYVNGLQDLDQRVVRAVGDPRARFREDFLRMLRAIRFASVLEFEIDSQTFDAIKEAAPHILQISAERIFQELDRIWTESDKPGRGLYLLRDSGLLEHILPEVMAMNGVEQPPEFHPEGDVFVHTALALNAMEGRDSVLAWSVLLHDVGKPQTQILTPDGQIRFPGHANVGAEMADAILRRLRASNELREAVIHLVRHHMRFVDWPRMKASTRRKIVAHPLFEKELALHKADCLASHGLLDTWAAAREEFERFRAEPALPKPWIRGRDLLALGIPEGPELGSWLRLAYDAQLEGRFDDRESLVTWLREQLASNRLPPSEPDEPTAPPPAQPEDSSA
ncbi:MAG: CCA tRNA nucleotidyltransferase [Kiritimatiellae bacterium]|nr:CCA tRNA nucleotidyltransferase [Kiritimatiellia bacterium]MDW8458636.1 CCA tRNA nucleotidyltransferase [Verrucomicrobiota bacterium]